jgi:4-hydroxybenzoate polyprenyltransferase
VGDRGGKEVIGMGRQSLYLLEAMRPPQWLKNLFIFAAAVFGKQLFIPAKFEVALLTFWAFCLLSSAVYIFNDLIDLKEDRHLLRNTTTRCNYGSNSS